MKDEMTLRDKFAMQMISHAWWNAAGLPGGADADIQAHCELIAKVAHMQADALMAHRKEQAND